MIFKYGDKVLHKNSEEEMIGTIKERSQPYHYTVSFYMPGREKRGYTIDVEIHESELEPCTVNI